jgi:hypothetical protein
MGGRSLRLRSELPMMVSGRIQKHMPVSEGLLDRLWISGMRELLATSLCGGISKYGCWCEGFSSRFRFLQTRWCGGGWQMESIWLSLGIEPCSRGRLRLSPIISLESLGPAVGRILHLACLPGLLLGNGETRTPMPTTPHSSLIVSSGTKPWS